MARRKNGVSGVPPVTIVCASEECGKSFDKDFYTWRRERSFGRTNFYCSALCAQSASGSRNRISIKTRAVRREDIDVYNAEYTVASEG